MRKLIEKFYSYSPLKRVLLLILTMIIVSTAITSYSFYNLVQAMNPFLASSSSQKAVKYTTLQALLDHTSNPFLSEEIKTAVTSWTTLEKFAAELTSEQGPYKAIATHSQDIENNVIKAIKDFNGMAWHDLIVFSSSQIDPLSEDFSISLLPMRNVARFLAKYQNYFKNKYPLEDSSFITSAVLKIARLTEVTWPFLIGKMVAIAIDGTVTKPIKSLLDENAITQSEAKNMQKALKISLCIEAPFNKSLESEFTFFKHAKGQFYSKAPLALWLLDMIYGNPDLKYDKLISLIDSPEKMKEFVKDNGHPLFQIFIPNFTKAKQQHISKIALKSILLTELSMLSGETKIFVDPFTNRPLKSLEVNGKQKFYSVGPDLKDDQMLGDDVKLEAL